MAEAAHLAAGQDAGAEAAHTSVVASVGDSGQAGLLQGSQGADGDDPAGESEQKGAPQQVLAGQRHLQEQ